jgi:hypothetical protein
MQELVVKSPLDSVARLERWEPLEYENDQGLVLVHRVKAGPA